jgi:nicotinamidase-related amidase
MSLKLENSVFLVIDLQQKLLPKISDNETVVKNCEWLTTLANKLNVPTLICEQYPKGLMHTHPAIGQRVPQSAIIEKTYFSAAKDVVFLDKLAALNKNEVVICGIEAHVCVLQTALDLKELDYTVHVVADSIGSRSEYDKKIAISRMQHAGISIVTKEMVLFEWIEKADSDLFRSISKEFLK